MTTSRHLFGFGRRAKRRSALLFIALWAMFSLSQAFAACCTSLPVSPVHAADSMALEHAMHDMDHGDQGVPERSPCPVASDDAAPPVDAHLLQPPGAGSLLALAPLPQPALPEFTPLRNGHDERYSSLAPPGRIYLRLLRILV